jgi:CRISPR/Cas system-associated exonuclease Cas4 (RecB family)
MSQFYNPKRKSDWNYGGRNWKLSRSKIDLFVECPRCFYIDNKLGTKRPGGFPFNLNSAVDFLLKKEFDIHRANETTHPLMEEYGIKAVPFQHQNMEVWRDNFKGVEFFHEGTSLTVSGAVDDIWINDKGELHVVDYKATSKDEKVNLDADWQKSYKRQMEVYQWLLRKNGFDVSDLGYFVYVNGKTDVKTFDAKLEFDVDILNYEGDASWIEDTLFMIKDTLEKNQIPEAGSECDFCPYHETRNEWEK